MTSEQGSPYNKNFDKIGINFSERVLNKVRFMLGITVATATLFSGSTSFEGSYDVQPANAGNKIELANDYPDMNATDCSATYGVYSWCKAGTWLSPRGYAYRNCTDWAAWRMPGAINMNVPRGWGNATNWDDAAKAAKITVDASPEPGDIAQWNGRFGHVAVVESVNSNGSVNVSEYNWGGDGRFDTRGSVRADNYIDLNGTGIGMNGQQLDGGGGSVGGGGGGKPNHSGTTTIGVFNPSIATFDLRNSNTTGSHDITLAYGNVSAQPIPVIGDWNGDGVDTIGLYNPKIGTFDLRNSNTTGSGDITFQYGNVGVGALPLAGDWNGDGIDSIGLYYPRRAVFDLRNTNNAGNADISVQYGNIGAKPVAGDWNGDGVDTIGVFNPSIATFDLRNSNTPGNHDVTLAYGNSGSNGVPLAGDWNNDGTDTIGLYNPSLATFDLRNSNTTGSHDITLPYGNQGSNAIPVVGDWDGR